MSKKVGNCHSTNIHLELDNKKFFWTIYAAFWTIKVFFGQYPKLTLSLGVEKAQSAIGTLATLTISTGKAENCTLIEPKS